MKTQTIAILLCFKSTFANTDVLRMNLFNNYINMYNKNYTESTYEQRYAIFSENLKYINYLKDQHPHLQFDINEYTDLMPHEFEFDSKGWSGNSHTIRLSKTKGCKQYMDTSNITNLPKSWDWREHNAVTSVKNQGQCGSCWSFSATAAMEGAWAISTGKLIDLSEQQVMDCSSKYINFGCNGGEMDHAFDYAIDNGMCLDEDIPYNAVSQACSDEEKKCNKVADFLYCMDVTPNNEQVLMQAVYETPVSVAIEADVRVFQFYSGGIIDSSTCGTSLDHGVVIVGYGTEEDKDYWIVKNSWGEDWGENGYVRIARGSSTTDNGVCGIAMMPSFIVA